MNRKRSEFPKWPLALLIGATLDLWKTVLEDSLVLGRSVVLFEEAMAERFGREFGAVGVGSGTDAIFLTLTALGVGPEDEVITPANISVSIVESIIRTGAVLRFADITPGTHTIDPKAVEKAINSKTRAFLPVHTYGLPADLPELRRIADENHLYMVELCGQAFGAKFKGNPVGIFGQAACFSFNPTKVMGGIGDGGALLTSDPSLEDKVRRLRNHGRLLVGDEVNFPGVLSRLDTFNARVLYRRLCRIDREIQRRRRLALYYRNVLPKWCVPQIEPPGKMSSYEHLVVELENRDVVRKKLQIRGIHTKIHYRLPYKMKGFQNHKSLKGMNKLAITEQTAQRVLTLPFGYGVGKKQIDAVCAALTEIVG